MKLPEALLIITIVSIILFAGIKIYDRENYNTECEMAKNEVLVIQSQLDSCEKREKKNNIFMRAKWQIGQLPYFWGDYDCFDHSVDLQKWLEDEGIKASIVEGYWGEQHHYWIMPWIESTTGEFIKPTDSLKIIEVRYNGNKCVCK